MPKTKEVTVKPVERLKSILATDSVKDQFQNAMAENSGLFIASLIDIYGGDKSLQKCEPGAVVMEALKAAVLKLPLNRSLGFSWLIARKIKGKYIPVFQRGYRGLTQLALRTGYYKYLNAGIIYNGQEVKTDILTGNIEIIGVPKNDKAIGYFAFFELLNGFKKATYWTRDKVVAHAKRHVPAYNLPGSAWKTDFDPMARKTVLTNLLDKYGLLSVEMVSAFSGFNSDNETMTPEGSLEKNVKENANKEVLDVGQDSEMSDEEKTEAMQDEINDQDHVCNGNGPGF